MICKRELLSLGGCLWLGVSEHRLGAELDLLRNRQGILKMVSQLQVQSLDHGCHQSHRLPCSVQMRPS